MADERIPVGVAPAVDELDDPEGPGHVVVVPKAGVTLVRLRGDVDLSLSGRLSDAAEVCLGRAQPVRLDVSELAFIDSTGVGFVARLAAVEHAMGRRLSVVGASRRTSETLALSGLEDILDLA